LNKYTKAGHLLWLLNISFCFIFCCFVFLLFSSPQLLRQLVLLKLRVNTAKLAYGGIPNTKFISRASFPAQQRYMVACLKQKMMA